VRSANLALKFLLELNAALLRAFDHVGGRWGEGPGHLGGDPGQAVAASEMTG